MIATKYSGKTLEDFMVEFSNSNNDNDMIITITDIEYLQDFKYNSFGQSKLVRENTFAEYIIDLNNKHEYKGAIQLEGRLSEKEIKENIKIRHNIMTTEFIALEKKEEGKTTFTHIHNSEDGWVEASFAPEYYDKVVYLGNCVFDGDMFACYKENTIEICKGFAGSEFK